MPENPNMPARPQGSRLGNFNYCLWAKLIIAGPALTIAAVAASALFTNDIAKIFGGGITVLVLIWLSVKIDKIPVLSKKIAIRK